MKIAAVGDPRQPPKLGALAQFRREVRAGYKPAGALAVAAGLELAARLWRLAEHQDEAARCERDAAGVLVDAAALKGAA